MKYKNWSPDIWQKIREAIAEEKKIQPVPVAAFDADGTLWDTDLGEAFFKYQIEKQFLKSLPPDPWKHYHQWKESGDPRAAYLWLAQINKGIEISTVRQWAADCFKVLRAPIFEEQRKLIQLFHQSGVKVFVVTASVKWAVEPGAVALGIPMEQVLGVETKIANSLITDEAAGFMTYKDGKVKALLHASKNQKPFFCSGNSTGDTDLLASASRIALAVGAAKPEQDLFAIEEKLREQARKNNWLIHQF